MNHFIKTDGMVTCCDFNISATDALGFIRKSINYCPACGQRLHFLSRSKRMPIVIDAYKDKMMVKHHKPHIDFASKTSYYFEGKHGNVYRKESLNALIYNYKTGMLYMLIKSTAPKKMDMCRTFNNVFILDPQHAKFAAKCLELRTRELLPEIDLTAIIADKFGIKDNGDNVRLINAIIDKSRTMSVIHSNMFFGIMKDPKMALLPYGFHGSIPAKLKKKWATVSTRADAIRVVFNGAGKSFKKFLLQNEFAGVEKSGFNNRTNFAGNFFIMSRLFRQDLLFDFFEELGWDEELLMDCDMTFERGIFKHYPTNKLLAADRAFIERVGERRLLRQIIDAYVHAKPVKTAWGNQTASVMSLVMDTLRCWRSIYAAIPEFDVKRQNSIKNLHDYIAKEQLKVGTMNIEIKYSNTELKWNSVYNDITFTLAKETHTLIDVGNELRICVGGYADGAVKKIFNIVVGYKDGTPIVCMEVMSGKLLQAKLMGNERASANGDVRTAIKSFCRANKIEFGECYDLVKYESTGRDFVHDLNPAPAAQPVRRAFIMEDVAVERQYPF